MSLSNESEHVRYRRKPERPRKAEMAKVGTMADSLKESVCRRRVLTADAGAEVHQSEDCMISDQPAVAMMCEGGGSRFVKHQQRHGGRKGSSFWMFQFFTLDPPRFLQLADRAAARQLRLPRRGLGCFIRSSLF